MILKRVLAAAGMGTLFLCCHGCTSSGTAAYGASGCRDTSQVTNIDLDTVTTLGFTPRSFLALIERSNQTTAFEWVSYDRASVSAPSPAGGALTDAVISIGHTAAPPRWIRSTSPDCLSYLEVDLMYSISTADGLLAIAAPVTITQIDQTGQGGGNVDIPNTPPDSPFPTATTLGTNVRTTLGLVVQDSMVFGGVLLRYDTVAQSATSQLVLGRWPPVK